MIRHSKQGWVMRFIAIGLIIISICIFTFDLYHSFQYGAPHFFTFGLLLEKTGLSTIPIPKIFANLWLWAVTLTIGVLMYTFFPYRKKHIFK